MMSKPSKTGQLQTAYRKQGFFLASLPGGRFIISKEGSPLSGNLKRYGLASVSNVQANVELWYAFCTPK